MLRYVLAWRTWESLGNCQPGSRLRDYAGAVWAVFKPGGASFPSSRLYFSIPFRAGH